MLIDWFTVMAQIVNFLILVLLLKRFLYGPVIRAMEQRERGIAATLRDADALQAEAAADAKEIAAQRREVEDHKARRLTLAHEEAEAERRKLIEQARADIEALKRRWVATLGQEHQSFLKSMVSLAGGEAIALARKIMRELSGADLEQRVMTVFLQRFRDALARDQSLREGMAGAGTVQVRTAFPLTEDAKREARALITSELGSGRAVAFDTDERLALGIRVMAGGRDVTLSLDDYLSEVERTLTELVEREFGVQDETVDP